MPSSPAVTIGVATLYLGDYRDILPMLDQSAIHAVVTDPPYGIGYVHGGGSYQGLGAPPNKKPIIGDDAPFDPHWLIELADASAKKGGRPVLLWGASHYKTRLPAGGTFLCWDKSCGQGPADVFVDAEFAWMNRKNARCIYRHFWKGATRAGEDSPARFARAHPSQKPVELMRWCLEVARIGIGKTVFDPHRPATPARRGARPGCDRC